MRTSEIRLTKLKLRLRDKRFANHKARCTAIWQQPLQSVLALQGCSAMDLIFLNLMFALSVFPNMFCDASNMGQEIAQWFESP